MTMNVGNVSAIGTLPTPKIRNVRLGLEIAFTCGLQMPKNCKRLFKPIFSRSEYPDEYGEDPRPYIKNTTS